MIGMCNFNTLLLMILEIFFYKKTIQFKIKYKTVDSCGHRRDDDLFFGVLGDILEKRFN